MKDLAEQICSLIEQESNADCRGCMINPRCYVIDKLLALIESEKRKAVEDFAQYVKEEVIGEDTTSRNRYIVAEQRTQIDNYVSYVKAADNDTSENANNQNNA